MPYLQGVWVRYHCGIGVHTRQCRLKLAQSPREATHVAVHCCGRAVRTAPPHHAPQHDRAALRQLAFTSGVAFYDRRDWCQVAVRRIHALVSVQMDIKAVLSL